MSNATVLRTGIRWTRTARVRRVNVLPNHDRPGGITHDYMHNRPLTVYRPTELRASL